MPAKRTTKRAAKPARIVRFSSLTAAASCAATVAQSEDAIRHFGLPTNVTGEAAQLGNAFHDLVQTALREDVDAALALVPQYARNYGCDPDDLAWLLRRVSQLEALAPLTEQLDIERPVQCALGNGSLLAGTADLVRVFKGQKRIDVTDWKTGREQFDVTQNRQVIGYASVIAKHAIVAGWPIERATAVIWAAREEGPQVYTMDRDLIEKEYATTIELALKVDAQRDLAPQERSYEVGRRCHWCRGRISCPAYAASMSSALAVPDFGPLAGQGSRKAGTERKLALAERARAVVADDPVKAWTYRVLAGELREALDTAIKHNVEFFGSIQLPGNLKIGYKERNMPIPVTVDLVRKIVAQEAGDEMAARVTQLLVDRDKESQSYLAVFSEDSE